MSSGDGTPGRRLRLVPGRRTAELARVEALDALLRDVDDLRLTLETDLSLAASAVEAGEPGVAADILGADRTALHAFEESALTHLGELASPPRQRIWAQVHAAPIVAAAALVGVLVGVVPHTLGAGAGPDTSTRNVAASDSLQRLQELAENGSADEVRAASAQLHRQLADVVANAKYDPAAAQTALLLLTYEQSAIVRSGDSRALADVLRQSQALAAAIVAALPRSERPAAPSADLVQPTASAAPKPSPTASAKPKPSPTASPKASPSASPSPTKDANPLPSPPVAP